MISFPSRIRAQDDDDDDEEEGGGAFDDEDAGVVSDGGFFGMGSENYEEMPGGIFGGGDEESMDFLDSKRRPSYIPSFLKNQNKDTEIIHNNQESPVSADDGKGGYVHFDASSQEYASNEGRLPHPRHHPRFSGNDQENNEDYDQERRRRYSGYNKEDDPRNQPQQRVQDHQSTMSADQTRHPFESAFDVTQDYDRFPRGSFFDVDGFYGTSRLPQDSHVPSRLIPSFRMKPMLGKQSCDEGCNEEEDNKRRG